MALGKILVADDDRNIAELHPLYLEKEGYTTELLRTERKPLPNSSRTPRIWCCWTL